MDRAFTLAHALPPSARAARFRRSFTDSQRTNLQNWGCDRECIERLERVLPAIAYYSKQGPRKADVQALLDGLAKDARKTLRDLAKLLDATEREPAHAEARTWLLQAIGIDHGTPEAQRLLAALGDVQATAERAAEKVRAAPQTRARAHSYPVQLIEAALNVNGNEVRPSESEGSPFFNIVSVCYTAANDTGTDPQRAIRDYLKGLNGSTKK